MSATTSRSTVELESIIRRIVREELVRLLRTPARSLLEDWRQEGPEDSEGDDCQRIRILRVRLKDQIDYPRIGS